MPSKTITGTTVSFTIAVDGYTLTNLGTIGGNSVPAGVTVSALTDSVINAGKIAGSLYGVVASQGLSLTNQSGGRISSAGGDGVNIGGAAGSVTNAGSISGQFEAIYLGLGGYIGNQTGGAITSSVLYAVQVYSGAGMVTNAGSIGGSAGGVALDGGGSVTNQGGGTITSDDFNGVAIIGSAGTAINTGEISSAEDAGVYLGAGGTVTNQNSGTISGATDGILITGAMGTVNNYGSVSGLISGVVLEAGGKVTNQSGMTISAGSSYGVEIEGGTGTIVNAGFIFGYTLGFFNAGVDLSQGTVTNQSGGVIEGYRSGIEGGSISLDNAGFISAERAGVSLGNGGYVSNQTGGGIYGGLYGIVIETSDGTVTNQNGATIAAENDGGLGIDIVGGMGTVMNAGSIYGEQVGVNLVAGGTVTNQSGGTITDNGSTGFGVAIVFGAASVVNDGAISGAFDGIYVNRGINLTNQSTGSISGASQFGVYAVAGVGSLTNAGGITGGSDGIVLGGGGTVTNQSGGTIASGLGGSFGLAVAGGAGAAYNAGAITGELSGIYLVAGGAVTNQSGGTIAGTNRDGVQVVSGAGTVINAGGITGASDAVLLAAGNTNLVVVDPGALFSGTVDGGNVVGDAAVSTLELAAGSLAGSLSGIGSQYIDFANIVIDSGATWALTGTNSFASGIQLIDAGTLTATDLNGDGSATIQAGASLAVLGSIATGESIAFAGTGGLLTLSAPGMASGVVTGFALGDTIDLAGIDPASVSLNSGELDYTANGAPSSFALASAGDVTTVTDLDGGALVFIPCFAAGTRIRTTRGDIPVEALRPGDVAITSFGDNRTIAWIGHRRIDIARHPDPERVRPIRIDAGAFPQNMPRRDLLVSPDHALFIDGKLIPAKLLVNGASIAMDTECRQVTYYHVELEDHDILLAEGLPAESYLDTGNRAMFENGGQPLRLHADFSGDQRLREILSCAPLTIAPTEVEPVWRMLAERAKALGWALPHGPVLANDPDLYLLEGTRRLRPVMAKNGHYFFVIPRGDMPLRLMSRAARPCDIRPWIDDRRLLGVMVRRLVLRGAQDVRDVALDGPLPELGWWAVEWQVNCPCRWTSGDAALPPLGAGVLEVELAATMHYRIDDTATKLQQMLSGQREKRGSDQPVHETEFRVTRPNPPAVTVSATARDRRPLVMVRDQVMVVERQRRFGAQVS